jgi:hypothetical protein
MSPTFFLCKRFFLNINISHHNTAHLKIKMNFKSAVKITFTFKCTWSFLFLHKCSVLGQMFDQQALFN